MTETSSRNDINQETKITYVRIDIPMSGKYFQGTRTTKKKINEENKSKRETFVAIKRSNDSHDIQTSFGIGTSVQA